MLGFRTDSIVRTLIYVPGGSSASRENIKDVDDANIRVSVGLEHIVSSKDTYGDK